MDLTKVLEGQVRIQRVEVSRGRVEVILSARARLPFRNVVNGEAGGTVLRADAAATSRLG